MNKTLILVFFFIFNTSFAGIFDKPENLKVLNKDITSEELSKTMKSFALGLGVRCSHCHVGEEGKPLSTFDFASDEKDAKKTARLMMEMVEKINQNFIGQLENSSVNVECVTCHRGNNTPKLTHDVILSSYKKGGLDNAINKYQELREQYYGTHSHDFSESMLINVAREIEISDASASIQVLNKNLEHFPTGTKTLWALAQVHESLKQNDKAIEYLNKINDINPNPKIIKLIEKLKN